MHIPIAAAADWQLKFFCLFVGPLFCGARVRPNMLNMPKSASGDRASGVTKGDDNCPRAQQASWRKATLTEHIIIIIIF